jgi:hypothetical protein
LRLERDFMAMPSPFVKGYEISTSIRQTPIFKSQMNRLLWLP